MRKKRSVNRDWRKKIAWFNAIVIFLIPLIVFYKKIEITEELKMYFGHAMAIGDFFAYYKVKLLQFAVPISLIFTMYFKKKEGWKFKWDRYTVLVVLFAVSIIISTIMSEHKLVAIFGYPDRFEGAWTWLSYLIFSYSIYLFVENKEDIINIIKPFVYATGVASLIGVFQFIGLDLFSTKFGKFLILGSNYKILVNQLVFKFPKGTVYTTLYNPNYIGTMVAMVLPFIVYLFEEIKDKKHKILMVGIFIFNIIALIGSKSTGGLVGTVIVILIIFIYYSLKSKYRVKIGLVTLTMLIVMTAVVINTTIFDRQLGKLETLSSFSETTKKVIKDVQIDDSNFKIISSYDEEINIYHDNKNIYIYDKDRNVISNTMDEDGKLVISNEAYLKWGVNYLKDDNRIQITYKDDNESKVYSINVLIIENGYSIFGSRIVDENLNVESVNLFKNENALTDRGYIWNRTIPVILDHFLIGSGSDTFALNFPQNDIVGRVNARKIYHLIVDKPHNVFLGIAVSFGFSGLLLFIVIIINSLIGIKNNLMIILSLVGFFVAGIVNDSTVFSMFIVFIVIGIFSSLKNNKEWK